MEERRAIVSSLLLTRKVCGYLLSAPACAIACTADIRLATATIWAWFRGYGGAYYQATLRNSWKEFFKVARATAPFVVIQRAAFESANTVIELPCKIADLPPAGGPGQDQAHSGRAVRLHHRRPGAGGGAPGPRGVTALDL